MTVTLKPHQINAVKEMFDGCILKGGVGSGKTYASLGYFYGVVCGAGISSDGSLGPTPTTSLDLYVITTKKKRDELDWEGSAAKLGISRDRSISRGGIQLKVDSWNNIDKYADIKSAFFIFDEQRLVGSGAWTRAFLKIAKHNKWILLSATPGDTWLDYIPVFVANGFYKTRTEFLRRHVVFNYYTKYPKVERFIEEGVLARYRSKLLVDMPYERTTTRHLLRQFMEHDQALMKRVVEDRWHVFEDRPIRDVAEMFNLMRKLVNTDPSRLATVRQLLEKHPRLIVFYNFNYELEALRELAKDVEVAEWNGHKHEPLPEGDRWVYLVQYTAGAEGWDCTTTDATIFYSLNYSYKVFEQAQGRIDRMTTPYTDLYYYIFQSASMIDIAIWRSVTNKKNFNEKDFAAYLANRT